MTPADPARARLRAAGLPLLAAALGLGVLTWPLVGGSPRARTHVVEIRGFEYHPRTLEVAPGDTVVWINRDPVPHTATAEGGGWDSGQIGADGSWRRVVESRGEMPYTCTYHPTMRGRVLAR